MSQNPNSQLLHEPILQFATLVDPRLPKSVQKLKLPSPKILPNCH